MTYAEAVARILALRGGERAGMRPGLERIEAMLDAIGRPEQAFTIAQVGGTNGKGSISAMLAAILQAAGRRVGLYTSPHLAHYRERIRVDGRPISESDFVDGVDALGTLITRLDLSVFEAGTALALDHFCRERVDVAVLEVGLGGRLDATTVGKPRVVVLGPIDYDHQHELGDTLALIATEKAAIIRSGVAFSARQDPEAAAVITRRAAEAGVPLSLEGRDLRVTPLGFTLEAQRLDLEGPGWRMPDVACGLLGVYQPGNALLAAAAARELGADEGAIRAGLRGARWPGRFQIFRREPLVILDGAHNPAGARALAASLRAYLPGPARDLRHRRARRQGRGRHPGRPSAAGRPRHPHRLRESPGGLAGRAAGPAARGHARGRRPVGAGRARHGHRRGSARDRVRGRLALADRRRPGRRGRRAGCSFHGRSPLLAWASMSAPRFPARSMSGPKGLLLAVLFSVEAVMGAGAGSAWAQPGVATIRAGGEEATVIADQLQQVGGSNDLLIAIGNVEIIRGQTRLLADRVELNRDTGQAVAQGKVVFYDGPDRLVGERIDYNLKTGTGVVHKGSAVSAPYYHLSAERMDRVGDSVYEMRRGVFTTCEGDDPPWSFRFGEGTADLDDIVYGRDASFWVKGIPVLPWVPFFAAALRRERQSGFLFPEFGTSSRKGLFTKVPYFWAINDSQDLTVSLDGYTKRGIGIEGDYRYVMSREQRGELAAFGVDEFLRDDPKLNENRGWLSFRHDWQITPRLSFKVNANVVTDDLIFRDYGNRLPERANQRAETNVFVTQTWDSWSAVGRVLWYQDLTTGAPVELQRIPEIRVLGLRQQVPGVPGLLYETNASFVNFFRYLGPGGIRADFHPRLLRPIPVAGLFTVTPFIGGRLTYYDQRLVRPAHLAGQRSERRGHRVRSARPTTGGVRGGGGEPRLTRLHDGRQRQCRGLPARHRAPGEAHRDPRVGPEGLSQVRPGLQHLLRDRSRLRAANRHR